MNRLIYIFLISANVFAGTNFYVDMHDTTAIVNPTESKVLEGYVHNTSASDIFIQVTRATNDIPDGWTTSMCFGICYPPSVDTIDPLTIIAGDSAFFDITFNTDDTPAYGEAQVNFLDIIANETDSILFSVSTESSAPSISVSVKDTSANILAGQSQEFFGYVYNTGDKPSTVFMVRQQNNLPDGWSSQLCFGSCPQPTVDTVNTLIMNGDSLEYKITFYTNETPASGDALLAFYVADEVDTIKQVFTLNTTATDISDSEIKPVEGFKLLGNYPNPFNPNTVISYQLPALSNVELTVYDIFGKRVRTLANRRQQAGIYTVQFDGAGISSGTYFYQLQANGQVKTGKMLLIK